MRSRAAIAAACLALAAPAAAALHHHDEVPSANVQPRRVSVWVPDGLPPGTRLPVIYMHDGQNLFEGQTAYGGVEWGLDEAVGSRAIVVGVWNTGARWQEYMPRGLFDALPAAVRAKAPATPVSDAYLRFLVTELKPFIDARYPTRPERASTFVAGSSMGGLISMAAAAQYPNMFARAAALSIHWPLVAPPVAAPPADVAAALGAWLATSTGRGPIWIDLGTLALDASYAPYTAATLPVLARAGWQVTSCVFPETAHNEAAWRARLPLVLGWLLDGAAPGNAPDRQCETRP